MLSLYDSKYGGIQGLGGDLHYAFGFGVGYLRGVAWFEHFGNVKACDLKCDFPLIAAFGVGELNYRKVI